MRILVTGASGFIGHELVAKLVLKEHDVYALERYVTGRYVLGGKSDCMKVYGDLRDHFSIRRLVKEIQPEIVFHLAAISAVSYSYDHPQEVVDANVLGTINLAEACLREVPHFRHFLFASTSETYGNGPNPKTEETLQYPNSPYALSKLAAEKYLLYMRDAYDFPVTALRPFNTYGRKNNSHFVVERMVVQMLQGQTVKLGDPDPVRDLLYVDDHVNAYLLCMGDKRAIGQIFAFGSGIGVSIRDLADRVRMVTGFDGTVIWNTIPKRPLDIDVLIGSYTKAQQTLGWTPKVSLEEGLRRTVTHWKKQLSG